MPATTADCHCHCHCLLPLPTANWFAALAETQNQLQQRLLELTPTDSPDLRAAWEATARSILERQPDPAGHGLLSVFEQYLILVTCRDEQQQVELLQRFTTEGLDCRALVS